MASLLFYTLLIIFFQTAFVVVLSWCTLSCRFPPSPSELHEVTLMKLLYLYDPVACGRIESYNFTSTAVNRTTMSSIIWPTKNVVAAGFRWKLKFSLTLHMLWLSLGLASALYGRHLFGLYLTVLPFTAAGAALLVSDIYIVTTYLMDIPYTSTEAAFVVVLSWCTLSCRFPPSPSELHEVTLMKLLYLYDPVACGRIESYNFTSTAVNRTTMSSIIWPTKNVVAAGFRWKLKFSLTLHMLWLSLGLASALYGRHLFGLYLTVLPFTAAGAALLVSDIYIVTTYLMDIPYTNTEESIINYIGAGEDYLGELPPALSADETDTSWVPLLFAYMSSRAVVLWIINYWLVLDNFMEGLAAHRAIKKAAMEPKRRRRERQYR